MVHDDLRVEWIRQRVCAGFRLQQKLWFDELLARDDGRDEELIISFLNVVSREDRPLCLLFLKTVTEEDVEEEVAASKSEERGGGRRRRRGGGHTGSPHPPQRGNKVTPATVTNRKCFEIFK